MAPLPFLVKAVYEYSSPHDDDLRFPIGQVINVTEEEGDDWYYGEFTENNGSKQEGLFPRNFVKNYEPETPPRPSRTSRTKKEVESSIAPTGAASTARPEATTVPSMSEESNVTEKAQHETTSHAIGPKEPADPSTASQSSVKAKPAPPESSKPPPKASEPAAKASLGSFKDRINAFNKPAAPPVAPTKPSGLGSSSGSGFIKKAFVAPPPSKNAYVPIPREAPPQKVYRREEELEAEAQAPPAGEVESMSAPAIPPTSETVEDDVDQPKPTSLKERIALLQKQQMEQAARQADTTQKKEKPKRPPKKRMESQERMADTGDNAEDYLTERVDSGGETVSKRSMDVPRVPTEPRPHPTKSPESPESTPIVSPSGPPRQFLSDANDADMSGAADTEEGEDTSTSRDEADTKLGRTAQPPPYRPQGVPTEEQQSAHKQDESDEEEEGDEEEEVDPEVKKRLEIRERMAKMSGGMGMAGMFGPAGGMGPMPPRRQVPSSNDRKASGNERKATDESTTFRAPPVPLMPMPGLAKVRSPEQDATPKAEVTKEDEEDVPMSVTQGRSPTEMPDVEDLEEEPTVPTRRSTDRSIPPPRPHGKH